MGISRLVTRSMINHRYLCSQAIFPTSEAKITAMLSPVFFACLLGLAVADVIPITQAPYLVTIDLDNQSVFDGALVAPGWVLVAGTSITWFTDDDWANHVTIRAGSARLSTGGQSLKPKNYTWHEKFDKNAYDYNVALIQLDGEFAITASISTVPLGTTEPMAGSQVNVTAYGSLPDQHATSSDLQQFNVTVISRTACNIAYQDYLGSISNRIVCGGMPTPAGGICYGESGNPITQNGTLVAVYATSLGCNRDGMPALYTNLMHPELLAFIKEIIA